MASHRLDSIPRNVQRQWIELLRNAWETTNEERLGGRLKPPTFTLGTANNKLGLWDPLTRTLSINLDHVLNSHWVEVEVTLRHEMAHQVVDELFQAIRSPSHGELFTRAARMLGLHRGSRFQTTLEPQEQRIVERIHKLLSLSTSTNQHEAELAAATANRLLLKYNVDLDAADERARFRYRWVGRAFGRIPLEQKILASVLQSHFFVQAIWIHSFEMLTGKTLKLLELFGRPHNLDIAQYVYEFVNRTVDELWAKYRREHRDAKHIRSMRHDFRVGILMGFRDHLDSEQAVHQETGLVWLGDPKLEKLFAERHPRCRSMRGGRYRASDDHEAGVKAGRALRIRQGVNHNTKRRGRLLT